MALLIDMEGKTYNHWYVNKHVGIKNNRHMWDCVCLICNRHYIREGASIRLGTSKMCTQCSYKNKSDDAKKRQKDAVTTHGLSQTKLYRILDLMHRRCEDSKNKSFIAYGGRGISVCNEWSMKNVARFIKWAHENGYRDDLQIDRIDVNGNYEPSNCRWVTRKENARNTRTNRFVNVFGEKMTLAEAVERYGQVSYKVTHRRMVRGMSLEEALFTPNMRS